MKLGAKKSYISLVVFAIFLLVFAAVLLTYTRRVDGHSMLPTLEDGDLVFIQKVSASDIHIGDIIVYDPGTSTYEAGCSAVGSSVIHRVINITGTGNFVTKGDNNPSDDRGGISNGAVQYKCIAGKVVFVVPYIERLASLPYGLNYIIAILIFMGVIYAELAARSKRKAESAAQNAPPA